MGTWIRGILLIGKLKQVDLKVRRGLIMGFLEKLFGSSTNKSGNVAKERLQLVLLQDRIKLPPPMMEQMRDEIIGVISKYIDIDTEGIDITFTKVSQQDCLVANIPVVRKHTAQ